MIWWGNFIWKFASMFRTSRSHLDCCIEQPLHAPGTNFILWKTCCVAEFPKLSGLVVLQAIINKQPYFTLILFLLHFSLFLPCLMVFTHILNIPPTWWKLESKFAAIACNTIFITGIWKQVTGFSATSIWELYELLTNSVQPRMCVHQPNERDIVVCYIDDTQ